ncbi:uncharacterized protein LOC100202905 [Hydra vulgaris]|uniref:uncharacterized protein LOC100202905 n=1 Tax=Hydra vulgaris TaxID=6087 RepID=UPI000640F9FD|nr:uncharacterized protein LOC100202905 [Hydra vulgaris]
MDKLQKSMEMKTKDIESCICGRQELFRDNVCKKISSLSELTYQDLLKKAQEYRSYNINLLEKNRNLLLELQESKKLLQKNLKISSSNKDPSVNLSNESNAACTCEAMNKLKQAIVINHMWQNDYNMLKEDLVKANILLEDYRSQITSLKSMLNGLQVKSSNSSSLNSGFTNDDVEAFKQQMLVYKEDYDASQVVISKMQQELSVMKIELNQSQEFTKELMRKNETAKNNFDRVNIENVHILSQLRRLTSQSLPIKSEEKIKEHFKSPSSL